MKQGLSGLDLHFLAREFQDLVGARIDRIYQTGEKQFLFQLHKTGVGKQLLLVEIPSWILILTKKPSTPDKPSNLVIKLRKHLSSAKISSIKQLDFERIIVLDFSSKTGNFRLIFELFSKGNLILCNADNTILAVLESQHWSGRELKPKMVYKAPPQIVNIFDLKRDIFANLIRTSNKQSLVKSLAIDFGLGGAYAEEVCHMTGLPKSHPISSLTPAQINALHSVLMELINRTASPIVIMPNKKPLDAYPVDLDIIASSSKKKVESFNQALLELNIISSQDEKKAVSAYETKLKKLQVMVEKQKEMVSQMEISIQENSKKGELVYSNYADVKAILADLKKAREKHSWQEIKKKLKNHKKVKNIDEKSGKITLEL